jgi:hypothetical protein
VGIDGENLLPLLVNPAGSVREVLPLFNFWGIDSAQSMAVVTPEWKYIYWYYGGDGMKPTEELFHLAKDRIEMRNLAGDPDCAAQLDTMRRHYDAQLDRIARNVVQGHGHEPYPTLFSRTIGWEEKAPLLEAGKPKSKPAGKDTEKRARRKAAAAAARDPSPPSDES